MKIRQYRLFIVFISFFGWGMLFFLDWHICLAMLVILWGRNMENRLREWEETRGVRAMRESFAAAIKRGREQNAKVKK